MSHRNPADPPVVETRSQLAFEGHPDFTSPVAVIPAETEVRRGLLVLPTCADPRLHAIALRYELRGGIYDFGLDE